MRTISLLLSLWAALLIGPQAVPAESAGKPNLVFIMVDDMGRDWARCYGARHETPNLDRLAAAGVRFTNAWCAPICTPTRVELLTGQYPFRTGWTSHHDVPRWGGKGFDWDKFVSFARVLKGAGYRTAIGGKWQINDFRKHPDALERHGFDEHCVWTGYETGNPPSYKRYWDGYLMTNGKRATHAYGPDVINAFLIDFIKRHKDGPFLVYYPMMLVHGPHLPTPLTKDDPPQGKESLYAANVTYMDRLVGRIVKTVDELGIADNTVIMFTCDNGSSCAGVLGGKAYPNGKGQLADRGVHVPLIARAPGLTAGGRVCDDLVDFTDMLPTLAELAGAQLPDGVTLDGRSFASSITGKDSGAAKRAWIFSQVGGGRMVRDKRYLLNSKGGFYDLSEDPLQQRDLSQSSRPEHVAARQRLARALENLPPDGEPPFEGYRQKRDKRKGEAGRGKARKKKKQN